MANIGKQFFGTVPKSHYPNMVYWSKKRQVKILRMVPKCEIFLSLRFSLFYTIKPQWIGDLGTKMKNSKKFRF
jgi:hypothetical protein